MKIGRRCLVTIIITILLSLLVSSVELLESSISPFNFFLTNAVDGDQYQDATAFFSALLLVKPPIELPSFAGVVTVKPIGIPDFPGFVLRTIRVVLLDLPPDSPEDPFIASITRAVDHFPVNFPVLPEVDSYQVVISGSIVVPTTFIAYDFADIKITIALQAQPPSIAEFKVPITLFSSILSRSSGSIEGTTLSADLLTARLLHPSPTHEYLIRIQLYSPHTMATYRPLTTLCDCVVTFMSLQATITDLQTYNTYKDIYIRLDQPFQQLTTSHSFDTHGEYLSISLHCRDSTFMLPYPSHHAAKHSDYGIGFFLYSIHDAAIDDDYDDKRGIQGVMTRYSEHIHDNHHNPMYIADRRLAFELFHGHHHGDPLLYSSPYFIYQVTPPEITGYHTSGNDDNDNVSDHDTNSLRHPLSHYQSQHQQIPLLTFNVALGRFYSHSTSPSSIDFYLYAPQHPLIAYFHEDNDYFSFDVTNDQSKHIDKASCVMAAKATELKVSCVLVKWTKQQQQHRDMGDDDQAILLMLRFTVGLQFVDPQTTMVQHPHSHPSPQSSPHPGSYHLFTLSSNISQVYSFASFSLPFVRVGPDALQLGMTTAKASPKLTRPQFHFSTISPNTSSLSIRVDHSYFAFSSPFFNTGDGDDGTSDEPPFVPLLSMCRTSHAPASVSMSLCIRPVNDPYDGESTDHAKLHKTILIERCDQNKYLPLLPASYSDLRIACHRLYITTLADDSTIPPPTLKLTLSVIPHRIPTVNHITTADHRDDHPVGHKNNHNEDDNHLIPPHTRILFPFGQFTPFPIQDTVEMKSRVRTPRALVATLDNHVEEVNNDITHPATNHRLLFPISIELLSHAPFQSDSIPFSIFLKFYRDDGSPTTDQTQQPTIPILHTQHITISQVHWSISPFYPNDASSDQGIHFDQYNQQENTIIHDDYITITLPSVVLNDKGKPSLADTVFAYVLTEIRDIQTWFRSPEQLVALRVECALNGAYQDPIKHSSITIVGTHDAPSHHAFFSTKSFLNNFGQSLESINGDLHQYYHPLFLQLIDIPRYNVDRNQQCYFEVQSYAPGVIIPSQFGDHSISISTSLLDGYPFPTSDRYSVQDVIWNTSNIDPLRSVHAKGHSITFSSAITRMNPIAYNDSGLLLMVNKSYQFDKHPFGLSVSLLCYDEDNDKNTHGKDEDDPHPDQRTKHIIATFTSLQTTPVFNPPITPKSAFAIRPSDIHFTPTHLVAIISLDAPVLLTKPGSLRLDVRLDHAAWSIDTIDPKAKEQPGTFSFAVDKDGQPLPSLENDFVSFSLCLKYFDDCTPIYYTNRPKSQWIHKHSPSFISVDIPSISEDEYALASLPGLTITLVLPVMGDINVDDVPYISQMVTIATVMTNENTLDTSHTSSSDSLADHLQSTPGVTSSSPFVPVASSSPPSPPSSSVTLSPPHEPIPIEADKVLSNHRTHGHAHPHHHHHGLDSPNNQYTTYQQKPTLIHPLFLPDLTIDTTHQYYSSHASSREYFTRHGARSLSIMIPPSPVRISSLVLSIVTETNDYVFKIFDQDDKQVSDILLQGICSIRSNKRASDAIAALELKFQLHYPYHVMLSPLQSGSTLLMEGESLFIQCTQGLTLIKLNQIDGSGSEQRITYGRWIIGFSGPHNEQYYSTLHWESSTHGVVQKGKFTVILFSVVLVIMVLGMVISALVIFLRKRAEARKHLKYDYFTSLN